VKNFICAETVASSAFTTLLCQISDAATVFNFEMIHKNFTDCASFKEKAKSTMSCTFFARTIHCLFVSLKQNLFTSAVIFCFLASEIAFVAFEMIHFIISI